jgi:hypothetical protein
MTNAFTQATRTDGSTYWKLTDTAPDWLRDAVRDMHDGEGPNDWRYETAAHLWDLLNERDPDVLEDAVFEAGDLLTDVYTHNLTAWLDDNSSRVQYLDDYAVEYGTPADTTALLMGGQYLAITHMAGLLVEAMKENAE